MTHREAGMGDLHESMSPESAPTPSRLFRRAQVLLEVDGVEDFIDDQRALVTDHYGNAQLKGEDYYGRLARITGTGEQNHPILVALDRTRILPVSSTNPYALSFIEISGGAELKIDTGNELLDADAETRHFVSKILDDIAAGYKRDYVEPVSMTDRLKQAASRHLTIWADF